jgi:3-hydroxyisobutyrate dehydrogenase-like beta-hydroxyacid dehydrogenase
MVKDLDLALDLYRDVGAETPLTGLARQLYAEAAPTEGELDLSAIVRRWRRR